MIKKNFKFILSTVLIICTHIVQAHACPENPEYTARYYFNSIENHYPIGKAYQYLLLSKQAEGISAVSSKLKERFLNERTSSDFLPLILLSLYNSQNQEDIDFARKHYQALIQEAITKKKNCFTVATTALVTHAIGEKNKYGITSENDPLLVPLKNCVQNNIEVDNFWPAYALLTIAHPAHHQESKQIFQKIELRSRDFDAFAFYLDLKKLSFISSRHEKDKKYLESILSSDSIEQDIYFERLLLALRRISGSANPLFIKWTKEQKSILNTEHTSSFISSVFSAKKRNHRYSIENLKKLLPFSYCFASSVQKKIDGNVYDEKTKKEALLFIKASELKTNN